MLRFFACLALLLSFTTTSSAAPLFQTQVEQLRSQGLSEVYMPAMPPHRPD